MIIILDIIICIAFVVMTGLLDFYIAREGRRLDANHIQLPDFTLTVKNLPEVDEYQTLDQLRAELLMHLREIVKEEPQQIDSMLYENENYPPEDIVNVHFAQKNFQSYNTLIKIEEKITEGQRLTNK